MRKLRTKELNRLSVDDFKSSDKLPIVVILDNIRSLNNVGSVFRTSDALRISKIYLCGITPCPPHNDIHKTALGAEDTVEWEYVENTKDTIENLRKKGFKICSIEQVENSTLLNEFDNSKKNPLALIFGNEVKGVQQSVVDESDVCIEIPQFGTKHSLNISVSAGIVLWELSKSLITKLK